MYIDRLTHIKRGCAVKKQLISFLVCIVLLVVVFPITASADMGPKPSVVIDFEGISEQTYYVTLLSSVNSTGPYSAPSDGKYSHYKESDEDYPIFLKFLEYQDEDGYYFLQYFQNCSETHQFSWTYYPPSDFKILIYFADSDCFAISAGTYERYAFDSYFSVSLTDSEIFSVIAQDETLFFNAPKSYDYSGEIISLAVRIVLTIAVELLIALLFAFRKKKQFQFIVAVNLVTQIALNVALNLIDYNYGQMMFVFAYILLELFVFIIEAVLYTVFLRKYSDAPVPKWKTITYALIANTTSFVVGLGLATIIPGIF